MSPFPLVPVSGYLYSAAPVHLPLNLVIFI